MGNCYNVKMEVASLLILCVALSSAIELPKNWKTCSISDKERGKCLKEAAQKAYDSLVKGEKSLGVPSLDPLKDGPLTLTDSGSEKAPLSVKFVLSNYSLTGYKSGHIDSFKFDCGKLLGVIDLHMKENVVMTGHYNGSGKVLLIPVYGNGDFKFVFDGYKIHCEVSMIPVNGKGVLKIDKFSLHIQMSRLHSRLDNLFNGNKLLGENMNTVFNENWRALFDELSPSLDKEFERILGKYVKSVVERIPRNVMCPT